MSFRGPLNISNSEEIQAALDKNRILFTDCYINQCHEQFDEALSFLFFLI